MTNNAPVFEKIIQDYLHQITTIANKEDVAASLGAIISGDGYRVPFFDEIYTVSSNRVYKADGRSASHGVAVLLCKYLLLCPAMPSDDTSLVTYKDFRDAAPYVIGFSNTAEHPIADKFANDLPLLKKRCLELGGCTVDTEVSCDLAVRFQSLPNIPILLIYHDADEEFPAKATVLFQKSAVSYLDMECLAMVGGSLAYRLQRQ